MQTQMNKHTIAGCKLCKAPIAAGSVAQCHAACLTFACPGCVASNKASFNLINLKNHIFDYQCGQCTTSTFEAQTLTRPRIVERHTAPAPIAH